MLGVPASVLADKLAGHLVQEIILRGSQGGPLAPLVDQFNHDFTHIQLAELTSEVREALSRVGSRIAWLATAPALPTRDSASLTSLVNSAS